MSSGSSQQREGNTPPVVAEDDPVRPPSRRQVQAALARYARLPRAQACEDERDVAAALREDLHDLEVARAAATERLHAAEGVQGRLHLGAGEANLPKKGTLT